MLEGSLTAGQLSAFMFYALMVAGGVATISEVIGEIQRASGATERLIELSRMPQDIKEPQNPVDFPAHALADITFDNISFTYPGDENNAVFESLSFSVKAGERVALVGPVGQGKVPYLVYCSASLTLIAGRYCWMASQSMTCR